DYRNGVVTHLVVFSPITCSGTALDVNLDSVSSRLDPIQVNRGRFRVSTNTLDDVGAAAHIQMTGTITGRRAAGAISVSRSICNGHGTTESHYHSTWNSAMPSPPPPVRTTRSFNAVTPSPPRPTGPRTNTL